MPYRHVPHFPDGRLAIRYRGLDLPHPTFEGTGLTIHIVNPGADTPGMADEMRAMSREGRALPRRAPKK